MKNIRNFSIIAHIDHGKSTLSDRMLELTETIEKRKMQNQILDSMDLERERGITIKMQPVKMNYLDGQEDYSLNLIDTPGHIDFSYEVSRALKAVEGSILLVDATQGVQAQTLSVLDLAISFNHTIIPVLSKIDSPIADIPKAKAELINLLGCREEDILKTSGKTGEGIDILIKKIIKEISPPQEIKDTEKKALIFDFRYSAHQGIIIYLRVFSGKFFKGDNLKLFKSNSKFRVLDLGILSPEAKSKDFLAPGEIGYIVTGLKEAGIVKVGDSLIDAKSNTKPLEGYMEPNPLVWASIYLENQDEFNLLKTSLDKLKLTDSSLSYEEEYSSSLGRGFRVGFLGMLHLEITSERLKREFGLKLIITHPSIIYEIEYKNNKKEKIFTPSFFPDNNLIEKIYEPWVLLKIITPSDYLNNLMTAFYEHEANLLDSKNFNFNRMEIKLEMPLRELMRGFFDEVKSKTSGFGSINYNLLDYRPADVCRLDVLIAEELVPAFSKIVSKKQVQKEAEKLTEKLKEILPREMFTYKVQVRALGRILSSESIKQYKKDVTGHLYGGDITRKMKLREKQKKGKKKMAQHGKVHLNQDIFIKAMRLGNKKDGKS